MSEETKESARLKIAELVAKYAGQQADYESPDYNETQTRQDFINPFFKALGWDVDNEQGYAEAYREVVHELTVKIDGHTKRPDNAFRIGGNPVPLFLVETKKPSILLAAAADAAYQIRSYGWNKKIAVNILTNFREFAVYDCTPKPSPADNAAKARIRYFSYKNYSDEFDFLWNTFGRENIPKGGLDQFIQSDTQKKGTSAVDKEFLRMLEDWREHLAVSINKNNEGIGEEELNYAVQQTINRIVFLRMAEDRKIEPENSLQQAVGTGNFYQNVFRLFLQADAKYNSGLFDFEKDTVSPNLIIDNRIIKRIVSDLYYPNPYNFAIIPVEILGTAYERFLG
ncbi:MAG: hypothetical protein LBH00_02940, partial [Planctomycetaceae bacterium]|nr:hypothetical protein [Planctomycetaceae bacterium]